jgi:methylmalonyl-CoA/ethylmalonyl-CoA epimerase
MGRIFTQIFRKTQTLNLSVSALLKAFTDMEPAGKIISRIDHVSLAVKDFSKAKNFFEKIFGAVQGVGAQEDTLKYYWNIFSLGDLTRLEIMEPRGDGSFLYNFLPAKKHGGVHHITLETPDIQNVRKHLEKHGIPYFGYAEVGDAWKELFIHPKHAFGVLIQVAQMADPDDYLADSVKHGRDPRWSIEKTEAGYGLTVAHPGGGKVRLDMNAEEIAALIRELSAAIR